MKVQILRDNYETLADCKLPDGSVTARAEAALVDMRGVVKQICEPGDELRRQILIE